MPAVHHSRSVRIRAQNAAERRHSIKIWRKKKAGGLAPSDLSTCSVGLLLELEAETYHRVDGVGLQIAVSQAVLNLRVHGANVGVETFGEAVIEANGVSPFRAATGCCADVVAMCRAGGILV